MVIPISLQEFLISHHVDIDHIEELSGVDEGSAVSSFRVKSVARTYILKNCQRREFGTYTRLSPFFQSHQIGIPSLYFACKENRGYWVVIENIPLPFPKERWKADPEQLKKLYLLHANSIKNNLHITDPYCLRWDESVLNKVREILSQQSFNDLGKLSSEICGLLRPLCCIFGDPNPTNWGIRRDGELVIYDFERIGYGHPAIDLAITMPGLGTEDGSLEHEMAERYLFYWEQDGFQAPFHLEKLASQIHLAKIWSAVDFVIGHSKTMKSQNLQVLINQLEGKIEMFFEVYGE